MSNGGGGSMNQYGQPQYDFSQPPMGTSSYAAFAPGFSPPTPLGDSTGPSMGSGIGSGAGSSMGSAPPGNFGGGSMAQGQPSPFTSNSQAVPPNFLAGTGPSFGPPPAVDPKMAMLSSLQGYNLPPWLLAQMKQP